MAKSWRDWRTAWEADYRLYARRRGFVTFNDWPYHRRGFIECWAQPGFHRFWQVWNPGIAYLVYRVYLKLGGRRHWVLPTVLSFMFCGFMHTLLMAPFYRRWSHTLVVAFTCFGVLTVVSRYLAPLLRQERWPTMLNVALNVLLVIGSFDVGFRVDRFL